MMLIHTVAAGGGSILHYDGARLRVGPDSAGANPGPTCYRRGGPLTVTDANVMAGKLMPEFFPAIFGPRQDQPIDADAVRAAFARLAGEIGDGRPPQEVADGFLQIAVANMAEAIKKISVQRGYDITGYALNCFGGAGGQHACLVADALGITRVLIHPLSGLLSAYGMGLADLRATRSGALELPLEAAPAALARDEATRSRGPASRSCAGRAFRATTIRPMCAPTSATPAPIPTFEIPAYDMTGSAAEVGPSATCAAPSRRRTGAASASSTKSKDLVVEAVSVEAIGGGARFEESDAVADEAAAPPRAARTTRFFSGGCWHDAEVFLRADLAAGHRLTGPAIVIEPNQTIVVEDGWAAALTPKDHLVLERVAALPQRVAVGTAADPVMLEIFNSRFMSIAEQMGVTLQNTAYSVNIKERLDFSCAVFDAHGTLVANAPHMPVHLGSMDKSVETVIRAQPGHSPGRRLRAQRALQRRHASPRHHRRARRSSTMRTATILFWVGEPRPPCRCRRRRARVDVAAGDAYRGRRRLHRQLQDRRPRPLPRAGDARSSHRRALSGPQPGAEPQRPQGADRRQREGRRGAEKHDRLFRPRRRRGLYGPRAGQRRRERAPRPRPPRRFVLRLRDGSGLPHPRADHRRQGAARGDRRFHRHLASSAPTISTRRRR